MRNGPELTFGVPPELVELVAERVAELLAERLPAPVERPVAEDGRLALARDDAAAALGMSRDSFERHVLPSLRVVRAGRLRLVPVAELERWISENAAQLGDR